MTLILILKSNSVVYYHWIHSPSWGYLFTYMHTCMHPCPFQKYQNVRNKKSNKFLMSSTISICIETKHKIEWEKEEYFLDKGTTCCIIFIYERSSHKNAQFAYQKNYIQQQKLNNVVHNYIILYCEIEK